MSLLLRPLPPKVTRQTAEEHDALIEWGLVSIIAGERAEELSFPSPDEVREVLRTAWRQALLGREAIRQAGLPLRGGYLLASAVDTGEAEYLGVKTLVLARETTASSGTDHSGLLDERPDHPQAKPLTPELEGVAG